MKVRNKFRQTDSSPVCNYNINKKKSCCTVAQAQEVRTHLSLGYMEDPTLKEKERGGGKRPESALTLTVVSLG